jgi:AI-2 transport protein TqsA
VTAIKAGALPRALVILLGVAATVVALAGVKAAAWLLAPVLLALVIVITIAPVYRWLRRHRMPAWVATVGLVVVVYAMLAAFVLTLIVSVARLGTVLPQYADRFDTLLARVTDELARFGVGAGQLRQVTQSVDLGHIVSYLSSFLTGLGGFLASLVFVLALLFFLSVETNGFSERLDQVTAARPRAGTALREFAMHTRRYLAVTTLFGFIVAVGDTIGLALLGVPLALLWGLLSFVTNYIPNVGFVLGLFPPALLALLEGGWQTTLIVIAIYCLLNFVVQSLIQPYFVGDAVGLSAVLTFLSLVFWVWILGPLGAILAVPLTLLVKAVLVDSDPDAGWLASLLHLSRADSPAETRTRSGHRASGSSSAED